MGTSILIITDREQIGFVRLPRGGSAGKAKLAFLTTLWSYCSMQDTDDETELKDYQKEMNREIEQWFSSLQVGDISLCIIPEGIFKAYQDWVEIAVLRNHFQAILDVIENSQPASTWWFEPEDTIPEFETLVEKMSSLEAKGIAKVKFMTDHELSEEHEKYTWSMTFDI